ncbi:hypothetical protein HPB47_025277 [Ixodes persulcatus]|uniref:Uncharacterized protein n=1 Tax=Ixodes persulcatus TaxID=34615 RepID=A0AC60Q1Y5_IXOPE|nr:hypothetical protein HPB47_025277 [Ixodes persulcatus]
MSTPNREHNMKYSKITNIRISAKDYEAAAYITAPEDTSKGVINVVPEEQTPQDIERSLVNVRNPGILHARRMGNTRTIIIAFEREHGRRVPEPQKRKMPGLRSGKPERRPQMHTLLPALQQRTSNWRQEVPRAVPDSLHNQKMAKGEAPRTATRPPQPRSGRAARGSGLAPPTTTTAAEGAAPAPAPFRRCPWVKAEEQAGDPSSALGPGPDPGPSPVERSGRRRRRHHSHGRTTTNCSRNQARSQTNNSSYATAKGPPQRRVAGTTARSQGDQHIATRYGPEQQKYRRQRFGPLLRKTLDIAKGNTVVVVGNSNAPHPVWGYRRVSVKGRSLWADAQHAGLTLVTDPQQPTRMGNSLSIDTTPDLTFTKNAPDSKWVNTQKDLGSDHFNIATTLYTGPTKKRGRKLTMVEWDTFRQIEGSEHEDEHEEARNLQKKGRCQRLNRNLRRRIARLDRDIEDHANQWESTCSSMEGQLRLRKTWNLLRCLFDPDSSKTLQRQNLNKITDTYNGTDKQLLHEMQNRDYAGRDNPTIDEEITEAEARAEILRLRTKSATGPDGITNKILRNLNDESIESITRYMNKCREWGEIPQQWKTAQVVMIPKPGKKLQIENLRPISLTSCVGKLMKQVVLTRLNTTWRTGDCIQAAGLKAILGLDLTKAFDKVTHKAVLENLRDLGVGRKAYTYVRDFLSSRTAKLTIGVWPPTRWGDFGLVLSPFPFNVAMIGLPKILDKIKVLNHSLYSDDVTLWVTSGSEAQIEETQQRATEAVDRYATERGLSCSPQKSELLITIKANGGPIRIGEQIKVLGLRVHAEGRNNDTLKALENSTQQTIRLIKRIANRRCGMREAGLIRLVHH